MPQEDDIEKWVDTIRRRYESYLKTSFYFKDPDLRASFQSALEGDSLLKEPIPDSGVNFLTSISAQTLAKEYFPEKYNGLLPALRRDELYLHQEHAIRFAYHRQKNLVVATGTASGKTESFLYPIIFELYKQHLEGKLDDAGVRAMILYPMNALANDQRERLGKICKQLSDAGSDFSFTFGQYTGHTPENIDDGYRNGKIRAEERSQNKLEQNELIFREEMRTTPPHILLTNYSMLEYLLIRPDDSPLFDAGRGKYWQFIVLDEAHQYRGTRGMEMGMLIRRLKQRLRDGGRQDPFRCIATSATLTSGEGNEEKESVAHFAKELFGEPYESEDIIFGKYITQDENERPRRYHLFLRALEGAFLIHSEGKNIVKLNRITLQEEDSHAIPIEIALCKECGQHYYVGRREGNKLVEAIRDPSQSGFGVEYYLPLDSNTSDATHNLCQRCGSISSSRVDCECHAEIPVKRCTADKKHPDQLDKCGTCGYQRGGIGDPVQEIVHGSDGPNAVIATALHELLPEHSRKILAFADSRQEAAFFAWYAEDSYKKLRDRNLILRALKDWDIALEGLSIDDLKSRLIGQWEQAGLYDSSTTAETKNREVLETIYAEMITNERRISLDGVGLIKWSVKIPDNLLLPELEQEPWGLTHTDAQTLITHLLDEMRRQRAVTTPDAAALRWDKITWLPQQSFCLGAPGKRKPVREWGSQQSTIVTHYLHRLLSNSDVPDNEKLDVATQLMGTVWRSIREYDMAITREEDRIFARAKNDGAFHLNSRWLRVGLANPNEIWECDICTNLSSRNIHGICPRRNCQGKLENANPAHLEENHYRGLYQNRNLPPLLHSVEHTAQIDNDEARQRQDDFKSGNIHLLSSSTTFEVGVDLGDLEVAFLRNVPPEPFNYTQRIGRAGRRETPGLAVTYCRRNPHDLYHYENPKERMIEGKVHPPRLRMANAKIISRHIVAVALSSFFRSGNEVRFEDVATLVGNWDNPRAISDFRKFCENDKDIANSLRQIVPNDMHERTGLNCDDWIANIAGPDSHFARIEAEVCGDFCNMKMLLDTLINERPRFWTAKAGRLQRRMETIAEEKTLIFLSRKAVIPKYGFPVDVVELDIQQEKRDSKTVSLQRDLSQAIAEYAPGCIVVANKLEWESCGVKTVPDKQFPVKCYSYDSARNFRQCDESEADSKPKVSYKKYLTPIFGFVTPLFKAPKEPHSRTQRLYTTRPFFPGFDEEPDTHDILGVKVTKASPGSLVILCEGHNRKGFYICRSCGRHMDQEDIHKTPWESDCRGSLERFSLGHELITDVVRLQFQELTEEWDAYSLAYSMLLGMAEAMDVPSTDLNVTVTGIGKYEMAIILYDNVPGGAGLVAQLERESVFRNVLENAHRRVEGNCGCDSSCYGCLRSYRNQFAHPYLNRIKALEFLDASINSSS